MKINSLSLSLVIIWITTSESAYKKYQEAEEYSAPPVQPHPLDPLTAQEIKLTSKVIKRFARSVPWIFSSISLKEPLKSDLISYFLNDEEPPATTSIPRRSFSVISDNKNGLSYEVTLDLRREKVDSWVQVTKGHLPLWAIDEKEAISAIVLANATVIKRLADLGVTNLSLVVPEVWDYGYAGDKPAYKGKRMAQVSFSSRNFPNDNNFAHPLGFQAVVDFQQQKVLEIENLPIQSDFSTTNRTGESVPSTLHNYDPAFLNIDFYRKDVSPIVTSQPNGPSFKVTGNQIEWQKFKLRIGFNGREGLVLYNVNYNDNGNVRPLIYRASFSEVFAYDGDPRPPFHRNMRFHEGHYGIGVNANELQYPTDCTGSVKFFDVVINNKAGQPVVIKQAVCVFEEDVGILWKKTDPITKRAVTVRSQRLCITFTSTSGNTDLKFSWYFYQDASIKGEVKLYGIDSRSFIVTGAKPLDGTIVSSQVDSHFQQHFFSVRLDTEIDGNENTVVTVDVVPEIFPTLNTLNPYGNGFTTIQTVLRTPSEGKTKISPSTGRTWNIRSANGNNNPISNSPVAYKLIPSNSPPMMMRTDSPMWLKVGYITEADVWVTPYQEEQLFIGGAYLYNNSGVVEWVEDKKNASIENTDVVLWHTFGITRIPTVEDFPILPTESVGFWLKPSNFFVENPALDVPSYLFIPNSKPY